MSSYETAADFGTLYDAVPAYAARADVAFYVAEATRVARESRATVLELGCGTGRVLLPLARAGHDVTGIDASAAMLARCRAKLAREPASVRDRVALYEGDVRAFTLPRSPARSVGTADEGPGFTLSIAPFRILQHLVTPADQIRCLAGVRQHLTPGGRFVFDVFNPHFLLMAQDRSVEVEDTPERALPDGRYIRRTTRVPRMRWVEQVSDVELIYYVRTGTAVERVVQAFAMRWYGPAELEHLLARAGLHLEGRSEEHTSELQSRLHLVCRLLLEKKKKNL